LLDTGQISGAEGARRAGEQLKKLVFLQRKLKQAEASVEVEFL
jgi:hypothetical protein